MIQGIIETHTSCELGFAVVVFGCAGIVAAESSWLRSAGESHSSLGCHTCRNAMRHAMEMSEAPISTIHGLMKLEIRNCGIANETPVTRTAGQIATIPRHPAKAQMSQNGTISERNCSRRPGVTLPIARCSVSNFPVATVRR